MSREEQLKAIKAMQDQLTKLKAVIESAGSSDRPNFREMSEADRAKFRETFMKARQDREKAVAAIQAELGKLGGARPAMGAQAVSMRDLAEIRTVAAKEKATETTKRIDALIARQRTQRPAGRPGRPGEPGTPGAERGPRGPREQRGQRRPAAEGAARRDATQSESSK